MFLITYIIFNDRWIIENTYKNRVYVYLRIISLKYKIYLHLHNSVKGYLYYVIVKFKIQIYIYIEQMQVEMYFGNGSMTGD
jgi:hypothetical protein